MKINYLFTSIVALALLAACDNNPQRINSNQNVSYNNLNNCSDINSGYESRVSHSKPIQTTTL
jgi:starvation-inducible outer membrane lipoprotein